MANVVANRQNGNILTQTIDGMGNFFSAFQRSDERRELDHARMRNPATYLDEIRLGLIIALFCATIITIGLNSYFIFDSYVPTLGVPLAVTATVAFVIIFEVAKVLLGIGTANFLSFGWMFKNWQYMILFILMAATSGFLFKKSIDISTKGMKNFAISQYKKQHPVEAFDPILKQKQIAETTKSGEIQKNISLAMAGKGLDAAGNLAPSERGLKTASSFGKTLDKKLEQESKMMAVSQAEHDRLLKEQAAAAECNARWTEDFGAIGEFAQIAFLFLLGFVNASLSAKNRSASDTNGSRDTKPSRNRDTNRNVTQNAAVSQCDTDATADKKETATLDSTEILRWSARQIKGDLANLKSENGKVETVGGRIQKLLNKVWHDAYRKDFEPDYQVLIEYIEYLEKECFPVMAAKNVRFKHEAELLDTLYAVKNSYTLESYNPIF